MGLYPEDNTVFHSPTDGYVTNNKNFQVTWQCFIINDTAVSFDITILRDDIFHDTDLYIILIRFSGEH